MKSTLLICLTILMFSIHSFARDTLAVKFSRFGSSDNYELSATNNKASNLVVKIVDDSGAVIFSEMIQAVEQFYKIYNLSTLAKGKYNILIESDEQVIKKEVNVNQLKGSHPDLGKNMIVGFSKMKDRQMSVVIQNKNKAVVEVTLYTNSNKKVNTIVTTKEALTKQLLDLSSLKQGHYKLKISDGKSVFSHDVTIY